MTQRTDLNGRVVTIRTFDSGHLVIAPDAGGFLGLGKSEDWNVLRGPSGAPCANGVFTLEGRGEGRYLIHHIEQDKYIFCSNDGGHDKTILAHASRHVGEGRNEFVFDRLDVEAPVHLICSPSYDRNLFVSKDHKYAPGFCANLPVIEAHDLAHRENRNLFLICEKGVAI